MSKLSNQDKTGSHAPALPSQPSPSSSKAIIGWLYATTASREEALRLGRALVEERLIACANILENMHSIYRWEGAVETAQEYVLIAKTSSALVDAAAHRLKALHSYECPCILSFQAQAANAAFGQWVDANVKT